MKLPAIAGVSRFAHLLGHHSTANLAAQTAEEDDDDKKREGESDEDYAKRMDAKKAKKAEDDDEEKEPQASAARQRERERCAAIFASPAAGLNAAAAAHLAFETTMPRAQAIAVLASLAATTPAATPPATPHRPTLDERMAAQPKVIVGAGDVTAAPDLAAQIVAAGKKARGEA